MSRVLTFSRFYPKGHPREGQATCFVDKIWASLIFDLKYQFDLGSHEALNDEYRRWHSEIKIEYKHHTIRHGHRFKEGDWFSPRVWSGKPYASKQITIAPDIQIKKTWDLEIDACGVIAIGKHGEQIKYTDEGVDEEIATNDGLDYNDFLEWLVMPNYRKGKESGPMQIVCWNDKINY